MNRRGFLRGLALVAVSLVMMGLPAGLFARSSQADWIEGLTITYSDAKLGIIFTGEEYGTTISIDLASNTVGLIDDDGKEIDTPLAIVEDYEGEPITETQISINSHANTRLIFGTPDDVEKPTDGLVFAGFIYVKYEGENSSSGKITVHDIVLNHILEKTPILLQSLMQDTDEVDFGLTLPFAALENIDTDFTPGGSGIMLYVDRNPLAAIQFPVNRLIFTDLSFGSDTMDAVDMLGAENVPSPLDDEELQAVVASIRENFDDIAAEIKAEATPSA